MIKGLLSHTGKKSQHIAAAGVALIATWWQDAPVPAILALVAAILGTGEVADRKKKKSQGKPNEPRPCVVLRFEHSSQRMS